MSFEIDGTKVKGYDRSSSGFYTADITDGLVQLYDHNEGLWFAYDIQDAEAERSYYRGAGVGG